MRIYRTVHDSPAKGTLSREQVADAVRAVKARWEKQDPRGEHERGRKTEARRRASAQGR